MPTQLSSSHSGFEQGFRHGFGVRSLLNSDPALPVLTPSFTIPDGCSWNESLAFTKENRGLVAPAIGVSFREDIFQPVLPASPPQSLQQPQQMQSTMSTFNCSSNTITSDPAIGGYNSSLELQETARLALGGYGCARPMQMSTPDVSPKNVGFRTWNHPHTPSRRKLQEEKWTLERIQGQHYNTLQPSSPSPSGISNFSNFSDSSSVSSLSELINDHDSSSSSDLSDSSRPIPTPLGNIADSPTPYPATSAARPRTSFDSAFEFASVPSFASQPDILAFSCLLRDLCTDTARRRYRAERLRAQPKVPLSRPFGPFDPGRRVHHCQGCSRSCCCRASPYLRGCSSDSRDAGADGDGDTEWQLLDYVSATVDLLWRRSLLLRRWRNGGPAGKTGGEGEADFDTAMSTDEARARYGAVREMRRLWAAGMAVQGLWEEALRGETAGREEMERVVVLAAGICAWVEK